MDLQIIVCASPLVQQWSALVVVGGGGAGGPHAEVFYVFRLILSFKLVHYFSA